MTHYRITDKVASTTFVHPHPNWIFTTFRDKVTRYVGLMASICFLAALPATKAEAQNTFDVTLKCNDSVYFAPRLGYQDVVSVPVSSDASVAQGSGVGDPKAKGRRRPGGTDGGITITAGAHDGSATITYTIEDFEGRTSTVTVHVQVRCPKVPTGGHLPGPPNVPPERPKPPPPPPPPPPPRLKQPPDYETLHLRTPTHRATSCESCRAIAAQLNAVADKISDALKVVNGRLTGDAAVTQELLAEHAALTAELDECEKKCRRPQPVSWAGGFSGAQFAGSRSRVGTNEFLASTGGQTNHFDDTGVGFGGGINGGYSWQPGSNNAVVGIVLDANFLNDMVQHTFPGGTFIGSSVNFTASAQVRAGVLATPNLLLYGQTGVSVANQRLQINFGGPVTDQNLLTPGIPLGAGAEWKLPTNPIPSFGKSMSLFIDYDHIWWEKAALNAPAASPVFNYTWQRQSDVVKGGIRVLFGGPDPVPPSVYMPLKAPALR